MRTIFFNVDTQFDFMNPEGKLYIKGVESIILNLYRLTRYADKNKLSVINTGDCHTSISKEISKTPNWETTFPEHCIIGTNGINFILATNPTITTGNNYVVGTVDIQINEDLFSKCRNIIIFKDDFDVFKGNSLTDKVLRLIKPDEIIVYGVSTNVCVNYAVLGLLGRGFKVTVVMDAIKELPNSDIESILRKWREKGVGMITTEELLKKGV